MPKRNKTNFVKPKDKYVYVDAHTQSNDKYKNPSVVFTVIM